jgi:DMSO/TMAO reductase YedYZ molybdopterin-dependent catalytic subunit
LKGKILYRYFDNFNCGVTFVQSIITNQQANNAMGQLEPLTIKDSLSLIKEALSDTLTIVGLVEAKVQLNLEKFEKMPPDERFKDMLA